MKNLGKDELNRTTFKMTNHLGNNYKIYHLIVLIMLSNSAIWFSCNQEHQKTTTPEKPISDSVNLVVEAQSYERYYGDSTIHKIHQLMHLEKLLFDEAESLVLVGENMLVQQNGHFKISVSTESIEIANRHPLAPRPHKEPLSITRIQNEADFLVISFDIVDGSDMFWIGDVVRSRHSISISFDGLNGYKHDEDLVRYHCKLEIEKLGNDYNLFILNGDSTPAPKKTL